MNRKGLLVILSAPSGTGKGTLLDLLMKINENVRLSISATTRKPRSREMDGRDYFFKTVDEFRRMIENGELLEWVRYCDNYYGTPKKYIEDTLEKGYDIVLEIEVEGAMNIRRLYPGCISIFVLPPSLEELKKRIEGRGTENEDVIDKRINKARSEIGYIDRYEYVVVNKDIKSAVNGINSILTAEKARYRNNKDVLDELGFEEKWPTR
jgi:guanylate kinase